MSEAAQNIASKDINKDIDNDDHDDIEPAAGSSSASACIQFQLLGDDDDEYKFKPVYTHQSFENEFIPSCAPLEEDEVEAHEITRNLRTLGGVTDPSILNLPHPSFTNRNIHNAATATATARIGVKIKLTPSCRQHTLSYSTKSFETDARKGKERTYCKVQYDAYKGEFQGEGKEKEKNDTSTNNINMSGKKRKLESNTTNSPEAPLDDILEKIRKFLPSAKDSDLDPAERQNNNFLPEPIGTIVQKYSIKLRGQDADADTDTDTNTEFAITLADGKQKQASDYHSQVQKLALCFIENADCVDLMSDEGGGTWKVLYIFRKHKHKRWTKRVNLDADVDVADDDEDDDSKAAFTGYSLVGYMTLFGFFAPLRKPKSGIIMRICQALVLPPFQRQGHGKRMMRAVNDYAYGKFDDLLKGSKGDGNGNGNRDGNDAVMQGDIVEVNVEDPAPGFTYMRDAVDYEYFQAAIVDDGEIKDIIHPYLEINKYDSLSETNAKAVATLAKKTPTQIQIAYEIYKLSQMKKYCAKLEMGDDASSTRNELIEDAKKRYRLMVKKRLNRLYKEEIGSFPTKVEKQAHLSKLFDDSYARYVRIVEP